MRSSLPFSLLLHGGLLAWAIIGFQETKPFVPQEPDSVEVAIITEGPTQTTQGDRNSKNLQTAMAPPAPTNAVKPPPPNTKPPEPSTPPPPPEAAKEEPPPPPKAAETPPPPPPKPPEPQKDEIAELALKAEAEAKAEQQRKAAAEAKAKVDALAKAKADAAAKARADAAAKAKAEKAKADAKAREDAKKPKEDFFDDMQKALKDNDPRKRAPQPGGPQVALAPTNLKGPPAGTAEGRDPVLTASQGAALGSMIKRAVQPCFIIDGGADGVKDIVVRVVVQLRPDGQLAQPPRILERRPGPLFDAVADAAMRAVHRCGPYNLPPDLYKGGWENSVWRFAPGEMF